jgi:dephospho-CoA kinase
MAFQGKPIIGIAGGIGSGKSFVARLFADEGCLLLSADDQVREIYTDPVVLHTLREWWGPRVIDSRGGLDRKAVASLIFEHPAEKQRLEALVHPLVAERRRQKMLDAASDAQVLAFVWDIPLLFEVGLEKECDAIVFVDAPWEQRLARVRQTRDWDEDDLRRRENLQRPLDNKREMSNYIVLNTADVGFARRQVREVLSKILANSAMGARLGR